jgi:hydrogenase expression/formation protein HypE
MREAADEAGVQIVAGDTKVVQKGKADGLYINTSGLGAVLTGVEIGGAHAQRGDVVILSGPIGDHGIAVLGARGELGFDAEVQSDVAPLNHLIMEMLDASEQIHVLRDPNARRRGDDLETNAKQSAWASRCREEHPVRPAVRAVCELHRSLYGRMRAVDRIVGPEEADRVLTMRQNRYGADAVIAGVVQTESPGRVLLKPPSAAIGSSMCCWARCRRAFVEPGIVPATPVHSTMQLALHCTFSLLTSGRVSRASRAGNLC